ncbi:hypothetical protein G6F57_022771 [Rhizopus arrhizus]|nr:hypothetical protein G6F31_020314 [Rhizopus arrhizus]KAG1245378.1 hypothetical protein G6F66_015629 [Rhizopus arrhizus]KAG1432712.1 hypothetical protein G6F57_022771 [Rhizopus arrhizus]
MARGGQRRHGRQRHGLDAAREAGRQFRRHHHPAPRSGHGGRAGPERPRQGLGCPPGLAGRNRSADPLRRRHRGRRHARRPYRLHR